MGTPPPVTECPRCAAQNREGRRFCAQCGAPLAMRCQACGFSNEPGEKFCGGCAAPLAAASPPPPPPSASAQAYTPKHLAEKILTSKSALEGERKGRGLLEQALSLAEQLGTTFQVALGKAFLAACYAALGTLDAVPALCQEVRQTSDRLARAVSSRALAEALSRGLAAPLPEAEQAMSDALQLFTELGFHPELARTYLCHAYLLQQRGQREAATRCLSEAVGMFRDMGMARDLERAERALREA